jgi:flagellar assembly protein FliH
MRNYSRFIPGEEIGAVEQWNFGAVDSASLLLAAQVKGREKTAEQIKQDALRQEGYEQGFAKGRAQATLDTQRQMADFTAHQGQAAAQNFGHIFSAAQAQLDEAEEVIAQGTLELACELARQVLRRELSVNPNALLPVMREALGLLLADNKSAVVHLNPLDKEVLEEVLTQEFAGLSLSLLANAALTRGGCLIESVGTVVDATVEKRWLRAVTNLGLNSLWQDDVDEH